MTNEGALRGLRVLVVEDNATNRFVVSRILDREGVDHHMAEDGLLALDAVREEPPFDLVLMDIQMPRMDGIEATRRLREQFSAEELPILGFTAHVQPDEHREGLEAGMQAMLHKPIRLDELVAALAELRAGDTRRSA